jgi:hypothetical protein
LPVIVPAVTRAAASSTHRDSEPAPAVRLSRKARSLPPVVLDVAAEAPITEREILLVHGYLHGVIARILSDEGG